MPISREQFDADREAVLSRARDAGVETILRIGSGTGPGSYDCAIELAEQKRENSGAVRDHWYSSSRSQLGRRC